MAHHITGRGRKGYGNLYSSARMNAYNLIILQLYRTPVGDFNQLWRI